MPRQISIVILLFMSIPSYADQLCFSMAGNYYEQVYCQLVAENSAKGLPAFHDFRKNDERIQALLLKPHARRIGIAIALPKKKQKVVNSHSLSRVSGSSTVSTVAKPVTTQAIQKASGCTPVGKTLHCAAGRYQLLGNKTNRQLGKDIFTEANRMNLPQFSGALTDARVVDTYLQQAYGQYINKMMQLGLGGVTMSYGKFAYLLDDYQAKSVSFVDRFETMYFYLKKDKQSNAISTGVTVPSGMQYDNCQVFRQFVACAYNNRNYVYVAQVD